jgi:hypothetical protein
MPNTADPIAGLSTGLRECRKNVCRWGVVADRVGVDEPGRAQILRYMGKPAGTQRCYDESKGEGSLRIRGTAIDANGRKECFDRRSA